MKKTTIKIGLLFLLISLTLNLYTQEQKGLNWNGYLQTRLSSDFDKSTEFSIRRAKLWLYGSLPKAEYISYKVQMVYRSYKDEGLMFQDAFADIRLKEYGKIRVGRFVPDFMLQRMQPDYEIPVLERAAVTNSLIHNEKQMAREVGAQYMFQTDSLPLHFSLGVFNANVDRPAHSKDNSLLYTSRLVYKIINQGNTWLNIGGSAAYRYLNKSTLTTINKPDSVITGDDFRWGVETQLHLKKFELQGEYIQANINGDIAKGWYGLVNYTFLRKYQVVALTERYIDLNPATNNNAWYGIGFNYQITGKTKLMTDFRTQESGNRFNYSGNIQLQIFFN